MSHYAIVKRQRYWVNPEWAESKEDISWMRLDKIKYEDSKWEMFNTVYSNIIYNKNERGLIVNFWEGLIQQEILNIGEKLIIDGDSFTIKSVEKHINGNVTYQVDDLYENVDSYDVLLVLCEKKYEEYSIQLKAEKLNRQTELNNTKIENTTEIVKKTSFWQRLFN